MIKAHVFTGNDPCVDKARNCISKRLDRLYDGWSDEYDREYDNQAIWFVIERENIPDYTATVKLLFRDFGCPSHSLLPMERADLTSFALPPDKRGYAFEASGLSFEKGYEADMNNLVHLFLSWMKFKSIDSCYSICHKTNKFVFEYETRVLKFKVVAEQYVTFSSFCRKKKPVEWQVISQDSSARRQALIELYDRGASLLPSTSALSIKMPWEII